MLGHCSKPIHVQQQRAYLHQWLRNRGAVRVRVAGAQLRADGWFRPGRGKGLEGQAGSWRCNATTKLLHQSATDKSLGSRRVGCRTSKQRARMQRRLIVGGRP